MANEDDLGNIAYPEKPSDLRRLADEELARLYRKTAYAYDHPQAEAIKREFEIRLVTALAGFKQASSRASGVLILLTVALVALTGVLVWLTTRL